jgi:hypothetical protein
MRRAAGYLIFGVGPGMGADLSRGFVKDFWKK